MSEWDFGYGREPTEHHEQPYPQQPPYPYPEQQEPGYQEPEYQEPEYQDEPGSQDNGYVYPPEPQYQYPETFPELQRPSAQEPRYPFSQQARSQAPPYPYPYLQSPEGPGGAAYVPDTAVWSGDAGWSGDTGWSADASSSGSPGWSGGPGWSGDADGSDVAGWPGTNGYPGVDEAYDPPSAYPITYERDEFEGRMSPAGALPPGDSPPGAPVPGAMPGAAPRYSPWPDAPDPDDRFGTESPARPWRPAPAAGERGGTDRTQAWSPGRPQYPDRPGYPGLGQAAEPPTQPVADWPRGAPPPPQTGGWRPADAGPWESSASWPADARPWRERGGPWPQGDEEDWGRGPASRGRWLIPVALAVAGAAVGAAIVMYALGHSRSPAGPSSPTTGAGSSAGVTGPASETGDADTAPLTLAAARSVLSAYTTANNSANARRSTATLATVETGGSYAIDAGLYTVQAADGAAPYPAFTPVAATYYLPRAEAAGETRWFVVQVANAFSANPKKVTSTEYLLFTQAASGGAWQNAVEPYLLAGANAPQVAVGGDGLATAVSATATSLAIAPGQLAERTAAAIDGTGAGVTVADPGALADRSDQTFWRGKLPAATVTDAHATATGAAGQTFALLTTNGGALVFYTDAADLEITPSAGSVLHLTVPGFYSDAQGLSRAGLSYLDQFAAADPPAGAGTPRVVAEYSGLTGKS